MNSINSQKLISTFLILATAVSSSVLIFATTGTSAPVEKIDPNSVQGNLPTNAFLSDEIKQIAGFSTYNTIAAKAGGRKDNLTDYFAEKLLGQLAEDNDQVSLANSGSGVPFLMPDMSQGLNYFLKDPQVTLISSVNLKDLKIKSGAKAEDVEKYLLEVSSIVGSASDDYLSRLKTASRLTASESTFLSLNFILSDAIAKLYNVKVPAMATEYHAAIIKSLRTHSGLSGVSNDPLRSYFYVKQYDSMAAAEKRIVENATLKLNSNISELIKEGDGGLFVKYFGVKKASAITVFDIPNTIQGVLSALFEGEGVYNDVLQYVLKIATEVLKDQLINKLVQQTINWANNGFSGKPQYVENFGKVIDEAVESAGNRVLSDAMKNVTGDGSCPRLRPSLEIAFGGNTSISAGSSGSSYSCTFDQLGANLDDFANSFSDGGWIAYRNVITRPEGNFMSAYIDISDKMVSEQKEKDDEKKQEIQTGGGFLNMQKCKNENVATGADAAQFATVAEAKSSLGSAFVRATCPAGGPCTEVVACEAAGGGDGWETTTPGQIAGQATKDALSKSPIDRIVNANDITGLVSALVNAALTKLVSLAQEGVAGLVNDVLEDKSGSVADICAGSEDPEKCKEDIDGASAAADEQKSQKVSSDLKKMISSYAEIAQLENKIISGGNQAKFYLEQASTTCSTIFATTLESDVVDAQFFVQQNYDYIIDQIADAEALVPGIVEAESGIIAQLQRLDDAIAAKDLAALLAFDLGINPVGDTDEKKVADFITKLSDQMKSLSSAFGRKFSTVYELPIFKGDLTSTVSRISGDNCSITEIAKKINPDPNSCRMSAAEADCKKSGL